MTRRLPWWRQVGGACFNRCRVYTTHGQWIGLSATVAKLAGLPLRLASHLGCFRRRPRLAVPVRLRPRVASHLGYFGLG